MYAVVEIGGHQYKVEEKQTIFVNRLAEEKGSVTFDRVLLVADDKGVKVGTPVVSGVTVKAKVLDSLKADKVMIFKKKRRKGYKVKRGFRQSITQIQIEKIG